MSHIFEALQRSAAEGLGSEIPSALLATELLQAAERYAAAEGAPAAVCEPAVQRATGAAHETETTPKFEAVAERQTAAPQTLVDLLNTVEPSSNDTHIGQFSQFQSLKVLVPTESRLVCITDKESAAAEKFRFLGVRLRQLQQGLSLKKVLVTSTIPGEGKSMVAANLACTLARRTQPKTLLLEGDLRRPSLAQLLGLGTVPGISEWLQDKSGSIPSIYHLEGTGLSMLPGGSSPRNPLELMQSSRLSALMDQLTSWFDWIVIDSPPVFLGDTSIWMRLADGILLVVRQGTTQKEQLRRGLEVIEGTKLLGALLNSSANITHHDYYYQYTRPLASNRTGRPTE
jgi:capsular exopolysaccharide synthesis family protein